MLSYLKDGTQIPASDENQTDSQAEDYLTVSGQSQKVRKSTMILTVLFVVGGLGIWLMVKKTTPAVASAETNQNQAQLENALAQLDSMQAEMDSQMESVSGRFFQFNNVDQVGVEELKKNPFIRNDIDADSGSSDGGASQELAQIQQEAQVISMGMELWSVTETPKGICCMIDEKVLYQGDTYKNMTVKSIDKKIVTLEYKGTIVELKID